MLSLAAEANAIFPGSPSVPTRSGPLLLLAALGLLFFAPLVLHPTQVLYSDYSDILAQHIPAKRFLVRELHATGELPLWCPYRFGGESFVADPQVAMFYPPHWLLFAVPENWVGVGLSWLIVAHVIVAGWCMYAYARSQDLGRAGALVAAIGYMFAGKWLLHLLGGGHYITIGLAWLPLVVLCLERAIQRGSVIWATGAGAAYGLLALGTQPQWTFYAGLFLALWTLGATLKEAGYLDGVGPRSTKRTAFLLSRWAGLGAWTAVLGAALAAVQFLPTLEAAGQSMRSVGVDSGDLLWGGLRSLTFFFGPALQSNPLNLAWEDRGGFGVLWVMAAALAPLLCRGRVRYQALVWVVLLVFSFGASAVVQKLPGFSLFRQHARMLMIATFPVAYLAGVSTNALLTGGLTPTARSEGRRALTRVVVVAAILVGGSALKMALLEHQALQFHVYWPTLLLTVPVTFALLGSGVALSLRSWTLLWCGVLLVDMWGIVWPLVEVRREAEIYPESMCVAFLADHAQEHGRVLDRDVIKEEDGKEQEIYDTPFGPGAPQAMLYGLEALRGYNPLDNLRYKEYLQFIWDRDTPLRPLDEKNPLTFPVINDFPIRNKPLLDLLGVRYLLQQTDRPLEDSAGWRRVDEDIDPVAYNFIQGGVRKLPPYTIYENDAVYPRAFVVPRAAALPARENVLAALKETDFRKTVLLENYEGPLNTMPGDGEFRGALVTEYRPNRVVVNVSDGPAGCLVLADAWFPGWKCTVDGQPAPLYRANYLFRGVPLTDGAHEVVFTFRPESFVRGRALSLAALAIVLLVGVVAALSGLRRQSG
jgi:hypothetical protein